jgi:hypothetical protein
VRRRAAECLCPSLVPQVLRSLQHGALAAIASGLESNPNSELEGGGAADAEDAQHGASSLLAHHGAASLLAAVRRSGGRMDASTLALLVSAA